MRLLQLHVLLLIVILPFVSTKKPNIILILADDLGVYQSYDIVKYFWELIYLVPVYNLGYNDVSWHNKKILSPNLDKLAKSGIILENHYVQPICTPTRSALMTGYYPIHTGRQVSFELIDYIRTFIHTILVMLSLFRHQFCGLKNQRVCTQITHWCQSIYKT